MAEVENNFTVYVRLPFNRGSFVDPPPVAWNAIKERALWDMMSKQSRGGETNWTILAEQFEVTQPFLLQQAAWLYERQLSQVRAQMRKVGSRQSATPSPAPSSVSGSAIGGQAMRRGGSGGSKVPQRLSIQPRDSPPIGSEGSTPSTPAKARTSLPRTASGGISSQFRSGLNTSRPGSRQVSKDSDVSSQIHSRRGSIQPQLSRSPAQIKAPSPESSESEDELSKSKMAARRPNPSSVLRRAIRHRKSQEAQDASAADDEDAEDEDEDEAPPFLPFSVESEPKSPASHQQDPSATLRGGFIGINPTQRPSANRRTTSERIVPVAVEIQTKQQPPLNSSESSTSSAPLVSISATTQQSGAPADPPSRRIHPQGPLSPRQQAALAAAGLSPRRRSGAQGREGSDTSPSMGSSFSDLDDTSVTQSALEEALLSNMGNNGTPGMGSRLSGISQALRSRYFDAQGQPGR